ATAGVQLTLTPVPFATRAATTLVGPGGPDCSGPLGQPPIPGPPGSPFSAMVMPWRLAAGSVNSHAIARSPSPALAAVVADSRSSKMYVATKLSWARSSSRLDEKPPLFVPGNRQGTAR